MSGVLHSGYKGGVAILGLTTYGTHKSTLGLYEDVRKQEGTEVLEVKCVYCGRWFIPTRNAVSSRLRAINNLNKGEGRFYCSENCKQVDLSNMRKNYIRNSVTCASHGPSWSEPNVPKRHGQLCNVM
jgi:endogenous inhibitor of DNA gyrase (YacG/DUF329 family)